MSGGVAHKNDLLRARWQEITEAEYFLKVLTACHVPSEKILLEIEATNTGANVRLGYEMLRKASLLPKSILLLQKPYMERRTYATFMKQWPQADDIDIQVSSPCIVFEEYFNSDQPFDTVVSIMVGDLERIIAYPKMGYQIFQDVPESVVQAKEILAKEGFNRHLLQQ